MGKQNNERDILKEKEETSQSISDLAGDAKHLNLRDIVLDISVDDIPEEDYEKAHLPISKSVLKFEEILVFQEEDNRINFYREEANSTRENEPVTLVDIKKSSHMSSFLEAITNERQHDLFRYEWERYLSFRDFPFSILIFPLLLAKHGFFSMGKGTNFMCMCWFCGFVVPFHKWIEWPYIQNAHYSSCSLRHGSHSGNVPITIGHVSIRLFFV